MNFRHHPAANLLLALLIFICAGWASAEKNNKASAKPDIKITKIPPSGAGPDRTEVIAGTVEGIDAKLCKVVVYAHTDVWYVQPYAGASDTSIREGKYWKSETHLGSEYAALLVNASYKAPSVIRVLPDIGAQILALARVHARE